MPTLLYLVRHGETASNREGRYQGTRDVPLADSGREQARRLARRLAGVSFDAVYASDLCRAEETAAIILEGSGHAADPAARPDPRLREMSFGRWEGLTLREVEEQYADELAAYRRDGVHTRIAGGESLADVAARVGAFAHELLALEHRRDLVVSHGGALKTLLFTLLGLDLHLRGRFLLDNTSLTIVRAGGRAKPRVLCVNDTSHLDRPLP